MSEQQSVSEQVEEIVKRFCEPRGGSLLGPSLPTLDISKPNSHESKADFLQEKTAVLDALAHAEGVADFMIAQYRHKDESVGQMAARVTSFIDARARGQRSSDLVKSAVDVVWRAAADVGVCVSTAVILVDIRDGLRERKQELADQEKEFWSGNSRPPNHYARTMALRLARLIAREKRQRPTIGSSRDGNFPSTDFGRALEDLFQVLGITANFRRAGTWAIAQLTDDDIAPPLNALAGIGVNFLGSPQPDPRNALMNALDYGLKGQGKKTF
ncbi:hypothetical protein [Salipiger sp.]|uniref:hypothetical protein n=1 Tax=Salipiger sp. TaxID=2078585 RepID=UPI003A977685